MNTHQIARIRRFNRAVTTETGALDSSFLGRGRPLGAARVLNAIGQGHNDVGAIRSYLGLDSGLASRLLRGLEAEGLVETVPHPDDARRRAVRLTEAGAAEFAAYEALSNARAQALLDAHPNPDALLAAMDQIATALGRDAVTLTQRDPRDDDARYCLGAYYNELNRRLHTGFEVSLSRDPDAADMQPPRGTFLVAYSDGLPIGCGGLKRAGPDWAEVKRVWVAPSARGIGLAKRLMTAIETAAQTYGYATLRLDTNSALPEAVALYQGTGWTEIPRFNDDPYPDVFFEKHLEL